VPLKLFMFVVALFSSEVINQFSKKKEIRLKRTAFKSLL